MFALQGDLPEKVAEKLLGGVAVDDHLFEEHPDGREKGIFPCSEREVRGRDHAQELAVGDLLPSGKMRQDLLAVSGRRVPGEVMEKNPEAEKLLFVFVDSQLLPHLFCRVGRRPADPFRLVAGALEEGGDMDNGVSGEVLDDGHHDREREALVEKIPNGEDRIPAGSRGLPRQDRRVHEVVGPVDPIVDSADSDIEVLDRSRGAHKILDDAASHHESSVGHCFGEKNEGVVLRILLDRIGTPEMAPEDGFHS